VRFNSSPQVSLIHPDFESVPELESPIRDSKHHHFALYAVPSHPRASERFPRIVGDVYGTVLKNATQRTTDPQKQWLNTPTCLLNGSPAHKKTIKNASNPTPPYTTNSAGHSDLGDMWALSMLQF
jgi:hypothetical protein